MLPDLEPVYGVNVLLAIQNALGFGFTCAWEASWRRKECVPIPLRTEQKFSNKEKKKPLVDTTWAVPTSLPSQKGHSSGLGQCQARWQRGLTSFMAVSQTLRSYPTPPEPPKNKNGSKIAQKMGKNR
eukprot:5373238-Amphidinium_carterae.2